MDRPLTGKLSTARCVWAPKYALAGTRTSPMLSFSTRVSLIESGNPPCGGEPSACAPGHHLELESLGQGRIRFEIVEERDSFDGHCQPAHTLGHTRDRPTGARHGDELNAIRLAIELGRIAEIAERLHGRAKCTVHRPDRCPQELIVRA